MRFYSSLEKKKKKKKAMHMQSSVLKDEKLCLSASL